MGCRTKKRTRIILIVVGLVLIIAGIIGGRLLIRMIGDRVASQNCLPTGKDSKGYETWVSVFITLLTIKSCIFETCSEDCYL